MSNQKDTEGPLVKVDSGAGDAKAYFAFRAATILPTLGLLVTAPSVWAAVALVIQVLEALHAWHLMKRR